MGHVGSWGGPHMFTIIFLTFISDPWFKDYRIFREPQEIMRHEEKVKVVS